MRIGSSDIVALVAVIAVLALALTGCQTKVVTSPGSGVLNTVTAQGEGKHLAAPDQAEMSFGVTTQGSDAKDTLADASGKADAVVAAIKKAGIDADDVQTSGVNLYPQYDYSNEKTPRITGYQASVNVRVTMREIDAVGDIISAAANAGATDISGPNFTLSEDAEARAAAIEKAVADAKARAEVMAKAAGKSVGEVVSISEAGVTVPIVYAERTAAADMAGAAPKIEPGTLDIVASVTVVYELK